MRLSIPMLLIPLLCASAAQARCSRTVQVPVAPIAFSVVVEGERVGGVYPDLLRRLGAENGCQFAFQAAPRARVEQMFERGQADVLLAATRSDRRDRHGDFVPLVRSRPVLIGIDSARPRLASMQALRDQRQLRVAVVRGFDFGANYRALLDTLRSERRLVMETDPAGVARALQRGLADVTLMTPSILFGTLMADPRLQGLRGQLRLEPLDELPWTEAGFYLNRQALPEADRQLLRSGLERQRDSGALWKALQASYPPGSLDEAMRPF